MWSNGNRNDFLSCIPTVAVVALDPTRALFTAFPAVGGVCQNICANSAAAALPKVALVAAHPAVVAVAEHVPAVLLAAVENGRAVIRRHPVANVGVRLRVAARALLDLLDGGGQESAASSCAVTTGNRIENVVFAFVFLVFERHGGLEICGE